MNVKQYMEDTGAMARAASREMARASTAAKNGALLAMAASLREGKDRLLAANAADVDGAKAAGLEPAMVDRLTLTAKGVETMEIGRAHV